ncbi:MAG: aminopeptidase P family protein [Desulfurococcaceae archaeon TW002]
MRLSKLAKIAEELNLDAVLITYEWNVFYYVGVPRAGGSFLLYEKGGTYKIFTPALDFWRLTDVVRGDVEVIPYTTYELPGFPKLIKGRLSEWITRYLSDSRYSRVGLDLGHSTPLAREVNEKLRNHTIVEDVSLQITTQRSIKEPEEIELIVRALKISENSFTKLLNEGVRNLSEKELAARLDSYMRLGGADGIAFETIVASGPNSAYPHAYPTDKKVGEDVVVFDFGARFMSYCSDTTRTLVLGANEEAKKALEAVSNALNTATDVIMEGIKSSEPDSVAREVLRKYGLENYFIHSLGHGVGLEVHERPRLAQGIEDTLLEGMVVTIEPGVYIHNKFGIRLENLVVVRKNKAETLNELPLIIHV